MRHEAGLDQARKRPTRRGLARLPGRRLWLAIVWLAMAEASAQQVGLEGTWQLRSVASSPVESPSAGELPSFTITGSHIEGFDGCNHFFGPLDPPGAIGATRRACPDATLLLPLDLSRLGAHLRSGRVDGDLLTVPARGPYPASTYVRQAGSEAPADADPDPAAPDRPDPDASRDIPPRESQPDD